MKRILHLVAMLFISFNLFSQAPQKMSYQAVIRNASNNLVTNAPVKMRISILQGSATGNTVYSELHSATTNANGLVSIEIGAGTSPTGTFSSINWGNGTYFLRTETDPNNGTNYTITGTSQLLSVPYALNSGNGINKISNSGDTIYLDNGKNIPLPGLTKNNKILIANLITGISKYISEIWIANIDGTNLQKVNINLPSSLNIRFPAKFSSDGKTIFFVAEVTNSDITHLYSCNIDGSNIKKIIDGSLLSNNNYNYIESIDIQ